jgi:pimeloyl-ACP methyl ester carboxylesterase
VPAGAEVMLVGHSYGAIAAMELAGDRSFNWPGNDSPFEPYHVNVTHVVAAGAGVRELIDDAPDGTKVLMAINRDDRIASAMQRASDPIPDVNLRADAYRTFRWLAGDSSPSSNVVEDGRIIYEFTAKDLSWNPVTMVSGHHYDNYVTGLDRADGAAAEFLDEATARYMTGKRTVSLGTFAVPDVEPVGGW